MTLAKRNMHALFDYGHIRPGVTNFLPGAQAVRPGATQLTHAQVQAALAAANAALAPPSRGSIELVTPDVSGPVGLAVARRAAVMFPAPGTPDIKFELISPAKYIDVDYNIEDWLGMSSGKLAVGTDTESSQAAQITLAPAAGFYARAHAFEVTIQQSSFQTPQGRMRVKATFAPEERLLANVGDTFDGTTGIAASLVPTLEVYGDFSIPADARQRRLYLLLCEFDTSSGRCRPHMAGMRTPTNGAGAEVTASTVVFDFTNLADGSGIQFTVEACTPGATSYDRLLATLKNRFGRAPGEPG